MIRLIIFIVLVLALDVYALQSFRSVVRNPFVTYGYIILSLAVFFNIVYHGMTFDRGSGDNQGFYLAFALFVLVYVPKLVLLIFMFGEDIYRLFEAIYNYFISKPDNSSAFFSSRRKFIGQLALGLASIPFLSILHGITKGKYNFKVLRYSLFFEDLPEAFEGYQITQISDIHSGSFDNKEKIEYAVNLVNEQESDVIMFTGDLVNSRSKEMQPWKSTFSKLKAVDGIFSVLGNHDYGDYTRWSTEKDKADNFQELLDIQKEMGFDLLRNESRFIEKSGDRLAIIGVENWGKPPFKQYGDLQKAMKNVKIAIIGCGSRNAISCTICCSCDSYTVFVLPLIVIIATATTCYYRETSIIAFANTTSKRLCIYTNFASRRRRNTRNGISKIICNIHITCS